MTNDRTTLCARCGFVNAPGDQFCGSCGAFLEWEGSAADGGPDQGQQAATTPASSGGGPTASAPAPVAGSSRSPAPPPQASPLPPSGPATDALLRCPACGIANPASRTFCQTCGAKLTPAARVQSRTHDEIAAAVAAVPAPRPVAPGAATQSVPPAVTARTAPPNARRGLPLWILTVIVLGVLAGGAAVVGSKMLQGSGPASDASALPSLAGSVAASASMASSVRPSASASTSPAASATPALVGKRLKLTGAAASSIVGGDVARYGPQNAIDGNLKTSWQEGATNEAGEWIEVSFDPSTVTGVVIRNGFQASVALFKGNLRLKDVQISVDGGPPAVIRLKDTESAQTISLTPIQGATHLRITIDSTYPAIKTAVAGTPFDDAAVSEIGVLGVKAP